MILQFRDKNGNAISHKISMTQIFQILFLFV